MASEDRVHYFPQALRRERSHTMNVLGVKVTSHDTGAALIAGGRVLAIAEERLCRVKHSRNIFPSRSIEYCLFALGVEAKDISLVVLDCIGADDGRGERMFHEKTGGRFRHARLLTVNHHDAHAASAFFASPFRDAAILVVDGAGERFPTHLCAIATETETLYRGAGNTIAPIQKTLHLRERTGFPYTFGIAKLYSLFTEGIANLGHYNEGKLMGLAPYGTPELLRRFPLERWIADTKDGHVVVNAHVTFPGIEDFYATKKVYRGIGRAVRRAARQVGFSILRRAAPGTFAEPHFFDPIALPVPRRSDPKAKLPTKEYADAAYLVQKVFEEGMVRLGRKLKAATGAENLCVAGGAGLNIDANKRFFDDVGFKRLFVQPAASDTGIALGCALWGYHVVSGLPRFWEMKSASLGRSYSDDEIGAAIRAVSGSVLAQKSAAIADEAADLIAAGKIVGWFQGGSEYGPRALGNRSILVDARRPDMKDIVNARVKHREGWRPFAASVLAERQSEWFELAEPSPFMLLAAAVPKEKRSLIPSVVHVDGTCRIQSVTREANAPYHALLTAFERKTGVPLVLNTSFNLAGEPIVETPADALTTFLATDMDYLILGDVIVSKKA